MNLRPLLLTLAVTLLAGTAEAQRRPPNLNPPEPANVVDVNSGQLDLVMPPTFTQPLLGQGIIVSFHGTVETTPAHSPGGTRGFRIYGGELDTNSGEGEFETVGNLQFNALGVNLILRHLQLDSTGLQPVITAEMILNGVMEGRAPIFTLVTNALFAVPLQGTTFQTPNAPLVMNDSFVPLFNAIFNQKALTLGLSAGSASVTGTTGSIPQ